VVVLLRKLKILDVLGSPNIISNLLPRQLCVGWELKFSSQNIFLKKKPEETPATLSRSVECKILSVCKADRAPTYTIFRISGLGLSKVDIGSSKIEHHSV